MTKEPTNKDIVDAFYAHSVEDHAFQAKTTKTDETILESLTLVHEKLEEVSRQIAHQNERLDSIESNMEPILELYKGLTFGGKALKWTSGIILAITIIVGSALATIRYLKG